jgi:hypothetical protein
MCPQLADFDNDGRLDLVMGTFEGTAFVVPRAENGWAPWKRIIDSAGRNVLLSAFWNRETEAWDSADRSPEGAKNPEDHAISAVVVDWDGDGDVDLVLGAKEGRLYVQKNVGTRAEPSYTGVNEPILLASTGRAPLTVPGGCTAPRVVDWNGDGLFDLVCGSFGGGVFAYLNSGTASESRFGEPLVLLANEGVRKDDGGPMRGTYVDVVDYDGDGDLDLVAGGYREFTPPQRVLSDDEKKRVAELDEEIAALEKELGDWFESAEKDDKDEFTDAAMEQYRAIMAKLQPLQRERDQLVPSTTEKARVYFYEREG